MSRYEVRGTEGSPPVRVTVRMFYLTSVVSFVVGSVLVRVVRFRVVCVPMGACSVRFRVELCEFVASKTSRTYKHTFQLFGVRCSVRDCRSGRVGCWGIN